MTLRDQLDEDLRTAMRGGDQMRRDTLRLMVTAIRNASIPPEGAATGVSRLDLDDNAVLDILRKQIKQRRDSIHAYEKAGRTDLAAREQAEIDVLAPYLPQQMSRDEITVAARAVIERVGATGPADKGKVMPIIMGELRDKADGREINAVVTELLAGA
jgi:uncharacterized protein YqeY